MSEEKENKPPADGEVNKNEEVRHSAGSHRGSISIPIPPPALPLSPEGKPLQPQIGADGKTVKGPPLGPDGKPVEVPKGPDGQPLPPPPIIGPDGKELRRPTDDRGHPLPIYVTPEGKPILGVDGQPIPLRFDRDGRPLPLELPAPGGGQGQVAPEDNIARFSLWTGVITAIVRLTELIVVSIIFGITGWRSFMFCLHQGFVYLFAVEIVLDFLPFVSWKMKKSGALLGWLAKNCFCLVVAITLVSLIVSRGCRSPGDIYERSNSPNSLDYIVLGYCCVAALVSIIAVSCLLCKCECGDDGSVHRYGQQQGQYGPQMPHYQYQQSQTQFKGQTYKPPPQQNYPVDKSAKIATGASQQPQQQQTVAQSVQPTNTTTIIMTPMTPMMNTYPMMGGYGGFGYGGFGGYGYGFGGYPYYGGYGYSRSYYAPYYDYGWGLDGLWW